MIKYPGCPSNKRQLAPFLTATNQIGNPLVTAPKYVPMSMPILAPFTPYCSWDQKKYEPQAFIVGLQNFFSIQLNIAARNPARNITLSDGQCQTFLNFFNSIKPADNLTLPCGDPLPTVFHRKIDQIVRESNRSGKDQVYRLLEFAFGNPGCFDYWRERISTGAGHAGKIPGETDGQQAARVTQYIKFLIEIIACLKFDPNFISNFARLLRDNRAIIKGVLSS